MRAVLPLSYFYPRPPRGGRRSGGRTSFSFVLISIHALREEGDLYATDQQRQVKISIHALREEGDSGASRAKDRWRISIHALREEGDER